MNIKVNNLLNKGNAKVNPFDFYSQLGRRSRKAIRRTVIARPIREQNAKVFNASDPAHSKLMEHLQDYLEKEKEQE